MNVLIFGIGPSENREIGDSAPSFCSDEQSQTTEERYPGDIGIIGVDRRVRQFTGIMKYENCGDLRTTSVTLQGHVKLSNFVNRFSGDLYL